MQINNEAEFIKLLANSQTPIKANVVLESKQYASATIHLYKKPFLQNAKFLVSFKTQHRDKSGKVLHVTNDTEWIRFEDILSYDPSSVNLPKNK